MFSIDCLGLPATPEAEKKLDIGDIEIEEDADALDAFLEIPETQTESGGKQSLMWVQ